MEQISIVKSILISKKVLFIYDKIKEKYILYGYYKTFITVIRWNTLEKEGKKMIKYNGNISDITLMLKHIMLDMDIKQKDLCNATGWTKATISNLLNNRTENPSLKILLELCNAMNCDLNIDIVPRTKEGETDHV